MSRAPRSANGLASIRGLALCLAEHHVHVYLAMSDAPSHFDADTAARACVGRIALQNIARCAARTESRMLKWILLSPRSIVM